MPTPSTSDLRRSFVKVLVLPALTFLLVPAIAVGFARYGSSRIDGLILASAERAIAQDVSLSEQDRAAARAFYAAHPASAACADPDPGLADYRQAVCGTWSPTWQFMVAERVGWAAGLLGLVAFLLVGALGLVAFWSRRAQYWSFMLGWRSLVLVTVIETVAQGALVVWLSYWITALVFERYFPKLILVAAVAALAAVGSIVWALLRKMPGVEPLEAERVTEADAPGLWRRVRDLAARLGTEPPSVIAAGIDDNFFVTEQATPLTDGSSSGGRLLYVSLPLLRTLSLAEADAVFGHELAHFHGGDTVASARLYPMLVRYEAYSAALSSGGLTAPASYVMQLYRAIFELALKRDQRRRELLADAEASRLTSPDDLGRSLLKIVGYSSFRARTEGELFDHRKVHEGSLALRDRIQEGLPAFAASPGFQEHVRTLRVPHPFDSHPPLDERLSNVAATVGVGDAAALLREHPEHSWADEVLTAGAIEERLWSAYEARFKADHEVSLAWQYLPATDEERALVLRHFPDAAFPAKGGEVRLTHLDLIRQDGARIALADIEAAKIDSGTFSNDLVLTRRGASGKERTFKVNLKALGKNADGFQEAFSRYWKRNQVARAAAAERGDAGRAAEC
jgi:Zn-dependent protease with chaperone function